MNIIRKSQKSLMHITYHGLSCFKIVAKTSGRGSEDVTIILGPFDKGVGLKPLQSKSDLAFLPHTSETFGSESSLKGEPVVISMPGEYAVKGVNIVSLDVASDPRDGKDRGRATISILDVEGMKVVYLGALGSELTPDQYDAAAGADILFLPIGDENGIDGKTAEDVARKVEAKVIIPMHYKTKGISVKGLRDEKDFCSNIGSCPKQHVDKLTLKKVDVEEKMMEVVFLKMI